MKLDVKKFILKELSIYLNMNYKIFLSIEKHKILNASPKENTKVQ